MNSEGLKRMLGSHIAYSDASTLARSCVMSISKPSPDLFLVVRLEKVLQGDISECAEPYLREDKNKEKVMKNANMKKIYLNILSRRIESRQELRIDYKIMKYKQISS